MELQLEAACLPLCPSLSLSLRQSISTDLTCLFSALATDNILITVIPQTPSSIRSSRAKGETRSFSFFSTAAEE